MRRGELLGLTWDAIDFENRVVHVRQSLEVVGAGKDRAVRFKEPKTEKSRRDVALTAGAVEILRLQRAQQSELRVHLSGPLGDEKFVFPNPRDRQPWKPNTFSNEFLRAVKASYHHPGGCTQDSLMWFISTPKSAGDSSAPLSRKITVR